MESIWSETWPRIPADRKALPDYAEVVVIGGGMAGLLCAYLLKKAGVSVIVLEADLVCSGQTKNTTAKITSQHGVIYRELEKVFGGAVAAQYGKLNERAIDEFEWIVIQENIDCGFVRVPSFLYTKTEDGAAVLKQEYAAARRAGILASLTSETELPFPIRRALKYERQAQFHPLQFLAGIVPELEIYEKTKVLKVRGKSVVTDRGIVEAGKIVFATHFPFMNMPGFYFARMHQERSYVLAVENTGKPPLNGMYYGIDADGYSFRSMGDTLMIGGKSMRTGISQLEDPYDALRREAERLWPDCREVTRWAAQDCMTLDKLPYIGRFSRWRPNWYVLTGFEKWGMTNSMIGAMAIRDMITGRGEKAWACVSPQRRLPTAAFQKLMQETAFTAKNFLTLKKPRCPHLGCHLVWNPYERTWDCPCHGSRFTKNGALIDNPAQNPAKINDK